MVTVGRARSSERKPPYHKIPQVALRRLALIFVKGERFDEPAERSKFLGEMNWQKGTEAFWVERHNHAVEHLLNSIHDRPGEDDLAAVMWYCACRIAYLEKKKGPEATQAPTPKTRPGKPPTAKAPPKRRA